jgi:hypothetical protein
VLILFVIVDASGMIAADPLAPTMQPEQLARLMAGEIGVADKLQMSFEAGICQGGAKPPTRVTRSSALVYASSPPKESRWSGRGTGIWISSHTRTVKMKDIPYRDETSSPKPREMSQ